MNFITTFSVIGTAIAGLVQWRSQFIAKAHHDIAVKLLENLSRLEGELQDYRNP